MLREQGNCGSAVRGVSMSRTLISSVIGLGLAGWLALPAGGQSPPGSGASTSPYVDQVSSAVRGLSDSEIQGLRRGEGMGLARSAELNGYPGPRHVLDLAESLALAPNQRVTVEALHARMQAEAIVAGEALLAAHAGLESAFRTGSVTGAELTRLAGEVGRLEGELRAIHLRYHLLTAPVLNEDQRSAYARLRGYTTDQAAPPAAPSQHTPGMQHGH